MPLSLDGSSSRAGGSTSDYDGGLEFDLVEWFERLWITPCMAATPQPMHGLCMYFPAFAFAAVILGGVALLAWMERRDQATTKKQLEAKSD